MKTNRDITFSYYSGNIFNSKAIGVTDLEYFIKAHKNPTEKTLHIIKLISSAVEKNDLKLKRALKQKLYTFTPSVFIELGNTRCYDNIEWWTGLMQIDFDGMETVEEAIDIKNHVFANNNSIVCAYLSPSGLGVKCLMRTLIPNDKYHYKALHQGMVNEFEQYSYLDLATKNAMLPLFLSADVDILSRNYYDCEIWNQEDWSKPDYVHLNDEENFKSNPIKEDNSNYNREKVIRIITNRINNIIDNGHPQVRSTSLILGSRVAAGYIDKIDAEQLIINLILNNGYLKKDVKGYVKTAVWAISQGMKVPKYF